MILMMSKTDFECNEQCSMTLTSQRLLNSIKQNNDKTCTHYYTFHLIPTHVLSSAALLSFDKQTSFCEDYCDVFLKCMFISFDPNA